MTNCIDKQMYLLFISVWVTCGFMGAQNYYPQKNKGKDQSITSIRVASVSFVPIKWEKENNWIRIESMVRQASVDGGADVVVTPEGILEGYVINEVNVITEEKEKKSAIDEFIKLAEPINGYYIRKACSLADELNIFFVFGYLESRDNKLYNTAIIIDPDGDIIGRYSKTHFAQGYEINPDVYVTGSDYPVFDTPFGKVGIIICYDRQLPEPARILALKGAQILFVPAYGSYTDENGWNTVLMRTRAYENGFPVVFCNPYQSLLIDKRGNIKAIGGEDEIVYYEVDTTPKDFENRFENRRPESYKELYKIKNP